MANITVQEVRDLVIDRLLSGVYPYSSKLPTARELAKETGAHRNTVAKAYQALADVGLVTLKQGRGTYVTGVVDEQNHTSLLEQIRSVATELIYKSRRLGILKEDLQKILQDEIKEQYGSNMLRAAYLECNPDDTAAGVEEIELLTGYRVGQLLLSTLETDTDAVLDNHDVIITSLFHMKDVNRILDQGSVLSNRKGNHNGERNDYGHDVKIVGVYTHPDEKALGEIAQIRPDARAAVIVSNQDGGRRLDLHVRAIGPLSTTMLVKPDAETLLSCAPEVDVFVCSRSMAPRVRALDLDKPIIELPFHISRQSAAKIVDGLAEAPTLLAG